MLYVYGTSALPGKTDMQNDLLCCYSPLCPQCSIVSTLHYVWVKIRHIMQCGYNGTLWHTVLSGMLLNQVY